MRNWPHVVPLLEGECQREVDHLYNTVMAVFLDHWNTLSRKEAGERSGNYATLSTRKLTFFSPTATSCTASSSSPDLQVSYSGRERVKEAVVLCRIGGRSGRPHGEVCGQSDLRADSVFS